jgi:hypothetical protein
MDALPQKDRATQRRKVATNAIVKASTRPGIDMGWVLGEIAAERDRLDERLEMSDGKWTWSEDDMAEAFKGTGGEPRSEDELLIRNAVYALYDFRDDPEFMREVQCRIEAEQLHQALPETVECRVSARL